MKKYYYLKQSLKPLLMMSCFVLTVQQGVADTSVSREMLNVLSEEANNTKMKNKQVESEEVKKEEEDLATKATLTNTTTGDDLSAKIEDQLRRVLGKGEKAGKDDVAKKDTDTELEKIVSSALLEGAKMDDIRSAVSDAMAEIKSDKDKKGKVAIDPELITTADKAFSKLTVTKKTPEPIGDDKTAVVSVTEHPKTVTVQEGESLFKIALRIYGDGNKYFKLYKANEDQIKDPNMLLAGQVLITPEF